jgi:endonuclease/exonuclease/phosphatase (EEP) superfamily protein YafD
MRGSDRARLGARVALGLLVAATLFAFAAPIGWPFELFSHFRVQYGAAALVLTGLLLVLGSPRAALMALAVLVWQAIPGVPAGVVADEPTAACGGDEFTVVTANLQFSNRNEQRFLDWLASHPADLVVVQEVTARWADALNRLERYPHRELLAREDPYGIGVLSRWPFRSIEREDLAADGLPSLAGEIDLDGQPLRFVALHTHWPIVPTLARARDRTLDAAARLLRTGRGPAVALGDLNLTPFAPEFPRFLDAAGLRNASAGVRWQPSWMAGFWPLALRIDHVLVSPDLCVEGTAVGPAIGSDHRPVIARLRFERPARGRSALLTLPPASRRSAAGTPGSTR